jgi:hypothetical protein
MRSTAAATAFGTAYTTCGAAVGGGDVHSHIITRHVLGMGNGCLQAPQSKQQGAQVATQTTGWLCL